MTDPLGITDTFTAGILFTFGGIGTVTGRFQYAVKDGADIGDEPDAKPAPGVITFTPSVRLLRGREFLIVAEPILVTLNATGSFAVALVATDDPLITPFFNSTAPWSYTVSFNIADVPLPSISIPVLTNVTQDLVSLM